MEKQINLHNNITELTGKNLSKRVEELEKENESLKKRLEEEYKKACFFKATIDALPNLIFLKDGQMKYVLCNEKYAYEFGIGKYDLVGKTVNDLEYLSKESRQIFESQDMQMIRESSVMHYETEFDFKDSKKHQALYWSTGFVVPETGERGLVGEIVDISKQKILEKEVSKSKERLADANKAYLTDFATGLGNRYALNEKLPRIIEYARKNNNETAILLADIDFFKKINDTYGHAVGDQTLIEFAKILSSSCRDRDVCIRYGGEEFLAILPKTNLENAKKVADRICDRLRMANILPNNEKVTVSIGVTKYIKNEHIDDCINRADKALYEIKQNGKDGFFVL